MDYFAVSLPDLQIWEKDLYLFNVIHCKYMLALGYWGIGQEEKSRKYLDEVINCDKNHIGVLALMSLMSMKRKVTNC